MAEFCTECEKVIGFGADIHIRRIANDLEPGYYTGVLCEGCGMTAIGKDTNGEVFVILPEDVHDLSNEKTIVVSLEDFERDHATKYSYHRMPEKPAEQKIIEQFHKDTTNNITFS